MDKHQIAEIGAALAGRKFGKLRLTDVGEEILQEEFPGDFPFDGERLRDFSETLPEGNVEMVQLTGVGENVVRAEVEATQTAHTDLIAQLRRETREDIRGIKAELLKREEDRVNGILNAMFGGAEFA